MKVVLMTPPASLERSIGNSYLPPMHLAYIGGGVRNMKEVHVALLDAGGEGLLMDEAIDRVIEADPDLVGLSVTSCDVRRSRQLLALIKAAKPGVTTVLGGHHPTSFDWLFLEQVPQVDMVMRGEVDLSFPELLRCIIKAESIAAVPGLSYRANGQTKRGVPQVVQDLDLINFPDRSLYDWRNYFLDVLGIDLGRIQLTPTAAIITSRGCPHHCTFCSKLTPEHHKYRVRSPENIVTEILQLNTEGYKLVIFIDENFTHHVNRLKRICELLLRHDLDMRFIFQGTLHNLSQSTLNLLHKAGFDGAVVGVESGSDAQLKRLRKAASPRGIAAGIRRAKKAHMFVHGSFVYGAPGETAKDREATRRFLKETRPHSCTVYELSLYPGTEIWKNLFGNSLPGTLEDTRSRQVTSVPGQADRATITREIRRFWRTFTASWLHYKRLRDVTALVRYNPLVRLAWKNGTGRLLKVSLQLMRGQQRSR